MNAHMPPNQAIVTAHAVIVVVALADGRFVLVEEAKAACRGQWSLPGGMLEAGESVFAAGVREAAEEAGVAVEPLGLLRLEHFRYAVGAGGRPVEKFRHILLARLVSGALKTVPDAESLAARAFSLDEAAALPLREPGCLDWLRLARDGAPFLPAERYAFRVV